MADESVEPNESSRTGGRPAGSISILLVDDDTTCLSIVAAMFKSWKYDVVAVSHPMDALQTLRGTGGAFDLVVTDVHMPDMDGFELQKKIDEEFNLPVVFMSADDQESVVARGLQSGGAFFLVKPINPNDVKNLWQYAVARKKPKSTSADAIENREDTSETDKQFTNDPDHCPVQGTSENEKGSNDELGSFTNDPDHCFVQETSENEKGSNDELGSGSSLRNEDGKNTTDSKRKYQEINDEEWENADDSTTPKKSKVVWTNELHTQFLDSIRCVGIDRAVPKKILELMNVPGLTRENVASHLQKYRMFLKKVSEASAKVISASETSKVERTFRSNFAVAQPYLKPIFNRSTQLGNSLQPYLPYYSSQNFSSFTNSPLFRSGQSRFLLNQTNFNQPLVGSLNSLYNQPNPSPFGMDQPLVGSVNSLYNQPNSSSFGMEPMEPTNHPNGFPLNGNGNVSGGSMDGHGTTTLMQPYQQRDHVVRESGTNDHITGCENIGDFGSPNLNPTPNNGSYVGFRIGTDGQLVGLSADHLNPNHGSTNVVQSESTSNAPTRLVGLSPYLNLDHGLMDVVQNEGTSTVPALDDPNLGLTNVFHNEMTSDAPIGLVGLSANLNINHGLINVVQGGIPSNAPEQNNPNHGSVDVAQNESPSKVVVPDNCNHGSTNVVQGDRTCNLPVRLVGLPVDSTRTHGSLNVAHSLGTIDVPAQNDPNHGSINLFQSEIPSNAPALNYNFDDYLGQGGSSTRNHVPPILDSLIQDGNNLDMQLSPSVLLENAFDFEKEGEIDCMFGLWDNNVLDNIFEMDTNPNSLQPYGGEGGFDIPSDINMIQPPLQGKKMSLQPYCGEGDFDIPRPSDINIIQPPIQNSVEALNYGFSFGPDNQMENVPVANNDQYQLSFSPDNQMENVPVANNDQFLEQPLGDEMMTFPDLGIDFGDQYFPAFEQTFDDQLQQQEDLDFLASTLFGTTEFDGYDHIP